ncbi:hypothetical protein F2Q69_00048360 [Brassica cretica]|uniref:Uncharacterized protein n=1 Tax=Brassica cretica TaxID=69181 RepID=A0A8S9Q1F2_BRACR|nr:hypothetical protein F2Q69_00048360 [Brassica cretica]
MVKTREACELLRELPEMKLGHVLQEIGGILPGHRFASVRVGVEMAMIDAAAKSVGVPMWKLFGGASNTITTNITIRGERGVVSREEAVMRVEKRCFLRNRSVEQELLQMLEHMYCPLILFYLEKR